MNFYILILPLVFLTLIKKTVTNEHNSEIVFDSPDLVVNYQTEDGSVARLEAFKLHRNDLILNQSLEKRYTELMWYSIGYPNLIKTSSIKGKSTFKYFHFDKEGFYSRVEMLTHYQKTLFKEAIMQKYKISVQTSQIDDLKPSKFDCKLKIFTEANEKVLINGKVLNFNKYPLRLDFEAFYKSKERMYFENTKSNSDLTEIKINCEVSSNDRLLKRDHLRLTKDRIVQFNLIESIFGNQESVYMTQMQLDSLANELYYKLNIVDDYETSSNRFTRDFISELIVQTSVIFMENTPYDQKIGSLSNYNLNLDNGTELIKRELEDLFLIKKSQKNEYIVLDGTKWSSLNKASSPLMKAIDANIINMKEISRFSENHKEHIKSLDEQLKQLNELDMSAVEWEIVGKRVKPKNLKVSLFRRDLFNKDLEFRKIAKETFNSKYKREFSLNVWNGLVANLNKVQQQLFIKEQNALQFGNERLEEIFNSKYDGLFSKINHLDKMVSLANKEFEEKLTKVSDKIENVKTLDYEHGATRIDINEIVESDLGVIREEVYFKMPFSNNPTVFLRGWEINSEIINAEIGDIFQDRFNIIIKLNNLKTSNSNTNNNENVIVIKWNAFGYRTLN